MSFALGSRGISPSAYSKLVEEREREKYVNSRSTASSDCGGRSDRNWVIFVYRNKKTWKSRLVKKYE